MNDNLSNHTLEQARAGFVHDLQGLDSLRSRGLNNQNDQSALREAAKHFESIFMNQLLSSMRSANEVFAEGNPLNTQYTKFYQDMQDQQMAVELSQSGSLGLADLIVQQLSPQGNDQYTPAELLPTASFGEQLARTRQFANSPAPMQSNQNERSNYVERYDQDEPTPARVSSLRLTENGDAWQAGDPVAFLERLAPYAQQAADEANISALPVLAQAALETGWGRYVVPRSDGESSNNVFNIKADRSWDGDRAATRTVEFDGTVARSEQAQFRAYQSVAESFRDYVNFLQSNPRYEQALEAGRDAIRFVEGLQDAGYATDPEYANKLKRIMNSDAMQMIREQFGL
ncbi:MULTISPECIES: flagellar assembly peptidoglycan hydrolase FlgJ [Gammaproteobacteria]|uniref:flagellar assembly peptidoglycan hydrolase FlgJ n=1 Tax=Gammaproteobacteria TaxID=1236 RepID=UPI000DCFDDE1|nr:MULTISPECIES: flagellar assembly peptidoglycan hydrolase FlgJ [Gammaproteobacteria]RTE86157.1 flagellar assembly peptidoglycan hydrolase FlgJ [Aliidiomarina sp. B3213]TCZ91509.1 flagellar assembly peptidoglycan hydrolase FlgJ [Lysobacter sp. N42]